MTTESINRVKHRTATIISDITFYASLINLHTDMCVFVNDHGHVGQLEVRMCESKSRYNEERTTDSVYYQNTREFNVHSAEQADKKLTNIKMVLKKILHDNKIDVSGLDYDERTVVHRDYKLSGGWLP
jgi:hypothetical protein